jgi:hypothetical protein
MALFEEDQIYIKKTWCQPARPAGPDLAWQVVKYEPLAAEN